MKSLLSLLEGKSQIIWDWNGTLLNDVEHNVQIMNSLLLEERLAPISVSEHREKFRFPVLDYYRELGFNTSEENFLVLCDRFNERYQQGLPACDLVPGIREVMAQLKLRNTIQCVLSASKQEPLEEAIEYFGLQNIFQFVCGIDDNKASSKLEQGRRLMQLSGIAATATALVGDTLHDLEVGRELGVDVILVDHGHQSFERLSAIHTTVVQCFEPNGNFIYESTTNQ